MYANNICHIKMNKKTFVSLIKKIIKTIKEKLQKQHIQQS